MHDPVAGTRHVRFRCRDRPPDRHLRGGHAGRSHAVARAPDHHGAAYPARWLPGNCCDGRQCRRRQRRSRQCRQCRSRSAAAGSAAAGSAAAGSAAAGSAAADSADNAAGDSHIIGFGYGFRGAGGQWWHDVVRLALTAQVGATVAAAWLDSSMEIAELHVHPDFQRRGIGRRLLLGLTAGRPEHTAALSTQDDNWRPASFTAASALPTW